MFIGKYIFLNYHLVCLVAAGLMFAGLIGCSPKADVQEPAEIDNAAAEADLGSVNVQFDFGDGRVENVTVEGIGSEQTVLDCLKKISQPEIVVNGSGQNAFVSSIGELTTTAGEGWSYRVNGKWADRSVGVYEIEPGDEIVWTHGGFEPE